MVALKQSALQKIREQAKELEIDEEFTSLAERCLIPLVQSWKPGQISIDLIQEPRNDACLAIVQPDRRFVVSTLRMLLEDMGIGMRKILHPVVALSQPQKTKISTILIELERPVFPSERQRIIERVRKRLKMIQQVVDDFLPLISEVGRLAAQMQATMGSDRQKQDAHATLSWLMDDNFIFLGHTCHTLRGSTVDRGIIKSNPDHFASFMQPVQDYVDRMKDKSILVVETLPAPSPIHRASLMNIILVVEHNSTGEMKAWHAFFGIWTSSALRHAVTEVPFIRGKANKLKEEMLTKNQSAARVNFFRHHFAQYTWDGFVRLTHEQLKRTFQRILQLVAYPQPRVLIHPHKFLNCAQIFLLLPRERYNPENRKRIISYILEVYKARLDTWQVLIGEGMFANLSLNVTYLKSRTNISIQEVEQGVAQCLARWNDIYRRLLNEDQSAGDAPLLSFPESYQSLQSPETAVNDTQLVSRAMQKDGIAIQLRQEEEQIRLTMVICGKVPSLVETYPMLERMGLPIEREDVHLIKLGSEFADKSSTKNDGEAQDVSIVYFYLDSTKLNDKEQSLLMQNATRVERLLENVWLQRAPDDAFNSLSWRADLSFEETLLWRTFCAWIRQIGSPYKLGEQADLLIRYPKIVQTLTEVFKRRHDPKRQDEAAVARLSEGQIDSLMQEVHNVSDDSLLRNMLGLIYAVVRTNFFIRASREPICIKIAGHECDFLKKPRPYREIYVEDRNFSALHMRMGPLARGGLRWSDRPQDFRDEVLGLVKAQHVKNVVIVPVGAKGGFVLKHAPNDAKKRHAYAIQCYQTFIRTILSITDNQIDGKVIQPAGVVCRDGLDPYLVVAADKGTATFSDYANEVSLEQKFWLGDAFASGGSEGYDHKAIGITARGAWESVKHHFSVLALNPEKDPVTVLGVGDMSGDVFGNGLLLSKTLHLVAAFNHRHVFVNPHPDPEACYQERLRLFQTQGSSWSDYDPKVLGRGGAVYDRTDKRLRLTKECQELIGVDRPELAPHELIRALLKLSVDLVWFGGVGTYVKAGHESHHQVSDPNNNAFRIDAEDLRCRVIGEGANLGMTQRARIIFSKNGGSVNTDFVDNCAGVNCSDHEVNLKILLASAMNRGVLSHTARNKQLQAIEPLVADHVLDTNRLLALALTMQEAQAVRHLPRHRALMRVLSDEGKLDRELEHLPDTGEIDRRIAQQEGLCRPELAVLLAYAKIDVGHTLQDEQWPWETFPKLDLVQYFPKPLRKTYHVDIHKHPLAGDIIATVLTDECLNVGGVTFLHDLKRWLGFPFYRLLQGYVIARQVMGFDTSSGTAWYTRISKNQQVILSEIILPMTAFFASIVEDHDIEGLIESYQALLPEISKIFASGDVKDQDVQHRPRCWFDEDPVRQRLQACYAINHGYQMKQSPHDLARKAVAVGKSYKFDIMAQKMSGVLLDPAVDDYTRFALIDRIFKQQVALASRILENGAKDLPDDLATRRFKAVAHEIIMIQNPSTEQMILWQQAVDRHLKLSNA